MKLNLTLVLIIYFARCNAQENDAEKLSKSGIRVIKINTVKSADSAYTDRSSILYINTYGLMEKTVSYFMHIDTVPTLDSSVQICVYDSLHRLVFEEFTVNFNGSKITDTRTYKWLSSNTYLLTQSNNGDIQTRTIKEENKKSNNKKVYKRTENGKLVLKYIYIRNGNEWNYTATYAGHKITGKEIYDANKNLIRMDYCNEFTIPPKEKKKICDVSFFYYNDYNFVSKMVQTNDKGKTTTSTYEYFK